MDSAIFQYVEPVVVLVSLCVGFLGWLSLKSWQIAKYLQKRDSAIIALREKVEDHEEMCTEARKQVEGRFEKQEQHFREIERALGRIEGRLK